MRNLRPSERRLLAHLNTNPNDLSRAALTAATAIGKPSYLSVCLSELRRRQLVEVKYWRCKHIVSATVTDAGKAVLNG